MPNEALPSSKSAAVTSLALGWMKAWEPSPALFTLLAATWLSVRSVLNLVPADGEGAKSLQTLLRRRVTGDGPVNAGRTARRDRPCIHGSRGVYLEPANDPGSYALLNATTTAITDAVIAMVHAPCLKVRAARPGCASGSIASATARATTPAKNPAQNVRSVAAVIARYPRCSARFDFGHREFSMFVTAPDRGLRVTCASADTG